jgi:hypothetical protein
MSQSEEHTGLSSIETQLLELERLQSDGDSVFPKGIFPSKRCHPFLPYQRQDYNLFFTASIVHILQQLGSNFTKSESVAAERIIENALPNYSKFQNKDGLDTYNFWQTKPGRHFPNGLFMNRFKHFQIPDDVDDTALVFLTQNASQERVSVLREKLKNHANLAKKRAFNPLEKYHDLKCYSTFFGEKMYIEFDVCVLSNLMRIILRYFKDNLNVYDKDTLEFICSVIENDEHLSLPFYAAPNYPTTDLILYHVARLLPVLPEEYLNRIDAKVKSDIMNRMNTAQGLNRTILESAAIKLGTSVDLHPIDEKATENDDSFFFFHAGMITAFENTLAQKLAGSPIFHLRYTSKALNRALQLENLVLRRTITTL